MPLLSTYYSLFGTSRNSLWPVQGRFIIFGVLGYFKLGALLEGLRRVMSYKSAQHVLTTFTEQVVPIRRNHSCVNHPSYLPSGAHAVTRDPKFGPFPPKTKLHLPQLFGITLPDQCRRLWS